MGGFLSDLFGEKPVVPRLPAITLDQEQQNAINANKSAMPGASEFANLTEDQILSMMRTAMPGFDAIRGKAGSNISDFLSGKIPGDVSSAITNAGAGKALRGGYGGSGMHGDLVARDLGLTSLNLMDKGLSSAESWMSASEKLLAPAITNFESMFVTPGQEYSTENEQNLQQFQRSWMKNQISAMPDPGLVGVMNTVMELLGRSSIKFGSQPGQSTMGLTEPGTRSASTGVPGADNQYGWGSPDLMTGGPGYDPEYGNSGFGGEGAGVGAVGGDIPMNFDFGDLGGVANGL
jgi:hypothetical protein